MEKVVLLRISGEITIKTPSVVGFWISKLIKNIKKRLYRKEVNVKKVEAKGARVFIESEEPEKAMKESAKIFGIKESILAFRVDKNIEAIIEASIKATQNWTGTFAVRARRTNFPLTSMKINKIVGERILEANKNLKVSLDNPDRILRIEVREDYAYVYLESMQGFGGLPYDVSGKGVALVSGGIDSALASWLMMKRGMRIVVVHADLTPYYTSQAKERFLKVRDWLSDWTPSGRLKTYIIPIGKIHENAKLPANRYRCIFCKMLMLKIAEIIAKRERAHAIITGETLSQVASQTPSNMRAINSVVSLPVLRPLIWMDKDEIDRYSQRIGLYRLVARDVGKCGLVPKRPAIEIEDDIARKIVSILNKKMLNDAIMHAQKMY